MKLLLDENLSPRLIELLSDAYPGSKHVQDVGLARASDGQVWAYAKQNGFVIVSKDSDFADMSVLQGSPPKVIWIRLGNSTTSSIAIAAELHGSCGALLRWRRDVPCAWAPVGYPAAHPSQHHRDGRGRINVG